MSKTCQHCKFWSGDDTAFMAVCQLPEMNRKTEFDFSCPAFVARPTMKTALINTNELHINGAQINGGGYISIGIGSIVSGAAIVVCPKCAASGSDIYVTAWTHKHACRKCHYVW